MVINLMKDHHPYLTQRDNKDRPLESCNVTALAQALLVTGNVLETPPGVQLEDHLAKLTESSEAIRVRDRQGEWAKNRPPREVYEVLRFVVNTELKRPVVFPFYSATLPQMAKAILDGSALVCSTRLTSYGHVVALTGFDTDQELNPSGGGFSHLKPEDIDVAKIKSWFVQDPLGDYWSGYKSPNGRNIMFTTQQVFDLFSPPKAHRKICLLVKGS